MTPQYTVRSTVTKTESRIRKAADITAVILISALLVFLLFRFVLVPAEVTDNTVSDLGEGEVVLVDRISKFFSDYELGDVLRAETAEGRLMLRVAAKAGMRYEVVNGRAYLDGALVEESAYGGSWSEETELSVTVPEGSLLLLPDDRANVSELEGFTVPYSNVLGEVRVRILPLGRIVLFS